jgi:hypothetical protein
MHIISFDIKGTVPREFVLAGQSIQHTTKMFYGECMKMCVTLSQSLVTKELAVASQHTVMHFLFSPWNIEQKRYYYLHPPTLLA